MYKAITYQLGLPIAPPVLSSFTHIKFNMWRSPRH